MEDEVRPPSDQPNCEDPVTAVDLADQQDDKTDNDAGEKREWWDSESQYLLDSQQLVEALSLCDEFLRSQSPNRDGDKNEQELKPKPRLADYAHLGPEHLKKDLEECQDLVLDPVNLELDTPPDFRLSQLVSSSLLSLLHIIILMVYFILVSLLLPSPSLVLVQGFKCFAGICISG